MVAKLEAKVGLHNRLPRRLGLGLLADLSKAVRDLLECLLQRLYEQIVLAAEMLVKTSMSQAGIPHNG